MDFALFLLVNAILFVRPAEIIPSLENVSIYEPAILACLVVSVGSVVRQLKGGSLAARPLTVCVLGLLPAAVLSHLSHLNFYDARGSATAFAKIVLYYLLRVGIVNSEARLRRFLGWLGCFILILATLGLLQYHGAISIASLEAYQQREIDEATGESRFTARLCGMGIFNDPNDLSLVLVWGMMISLHRFRGG